MFYIVIRRWQSCYKGVFTGFVVLVIVIVMVIVAFFSSFLRCLSLFCFFIFYWCWYYWCLFYMGVIFSIFFSLSLSLFTDSAVLVIAFHALFVFVFRPFLLVLLVYFYVDMILSIISLSSISLFIDFIVLVNIFHVFVFVFLPLLLLLVLFISIWCLLSSFHDQCLYYLQYH